MKRLCVVLLLTGCFGPKRLTDPVHHSTARSRQLMVLAAAEARHIPDADVRLTRQLNIANEVLGQYGKGGAVEVLHHATETLETVGGQLNGHALLAGWVSVAQLSRRASDSQLAGDAAARAMRELDRMPDPSERCDYVLGVAEEVSNSISSPAAVALLMKSGDWAASIFASETRRSARLAFASALFNLEDYDAGAGLLRKEKDALWSSDAMMRLASPGSYYAYARTGEAQVQATAVVAEDSGGDSRGGHAPPAPVQKQSYGKALSFEPVFEGRTSSTAK